MTELRRVWITWEHHRRSVELAREFGAQLVEFNSERSRVGRYRELAGKTLRFLKSNQPDIVFAQNPSIVLAALLVFYKRKFGFYLVIDRHSNFKLHANALPWYKSFVFQMLSRYSVKHAQMTIVTNEPLAEMVEDWGGSGVVLQDKIPDLLHANPRDLGEDFSLLFVCTYSDDEPVAEVFEAAAILGEGYRVYVSGKISKFASKFSDHVVLPENVEQTDFIPDEEYQALLSSVDATIVLTTRENLLTCGAYESIAMGKPIVLSGSKALRRYFSDGMAYTDNSAKSIVECVQEIRRDLGAYQSGIAILRERLGVEWAERFDRLDKRIEVEASANRGPA